MTKRDLTAVESPIKIFVGTEEEQMLAVKVLEYSIKKHATMAVEVTPLFAAIGQKGINVPEPQDPKIRPRTPFSFQRFAIPALKNYRGKAIYLDSDMLVFQDIKELWLREFNGADLLSVYEPSDSGRPPQFSVMVLNCQQLTWDAEQLVKELEAGKWTYKQFVLEMAPANKISAVLPSQWNDLERYREGETALTHYTDMPSQPWLKTHNPLAWVWCQELFNAIEEGFISKKFIKQEVKRGCVRPSLIYQIEHNIIDPLKLPESVIQKDKLEFTPPHEIKKAVKKITAQMQPSNPIRKWLNKGYSLSRYIWNLSKKK
ncbi:MAG: glycosyl transferase [Richelia sp. RM1_1_1]|nr:glycosyl transferase [Richelia sp. SM2_1_7]NJM18021.1 glycosyl transferase [Richelia sp. SM1_7_0]NJN10913.1 glycosyl transferase [Richelia sp. RM1_1_1]